MANESLRCHAKDAKDTLTITIAHHNDVLLICPVLLLHPHLHLYLRPILAFFIWHQTNLMQTALLFHDATHCSITCLRVAGDPRENQGTPPPTGCKQTVPASECTLGWKRRGSLY